MQMHVENVISFHEFPRWVQGEDKPQLSPTSPNHRDTTSTSTPAKQNSIANTPHKMM